MLAVDQRPPLFALVGRKWPGLSEAEAAQRVARLKALLVETLAGEATGVLLDPLYAYPEAQPHLGRAQGLLLTLEDHRFQEVGPGWRLNRLIPDWGPEEAAAWGADGLKLLLWYRPDAPEGVRRHQEDLAREVGRACRRLGKFFVLELLTYPLGGRTPDGPLLLETVAAFADPGYGVDLYKLPYLPGGMGAYTEALPAPWVLLSGGLAWGEFLRALGEALEAGARGFLAGRSFWWDSLEGAEDLEGARAHLLREGRRRFGEALGLLARIPPKGEG